MENYKYAVEGYEIHENHPLFTNCTITELHARRVKKRMEEEGLLVTIRTISKMLGLNPYYEKEEISKV